MNMQLNTPIPVITSKGNRYWIEVTSRVTWTGYGRGRTDSIEYCNLLFSAGALSLVVSDTAQNLLSRTWGINYNGALAVQITGASRYVFECFPEIHTGERIHTFVTSLHEGIDTWICAPVNVILQ